MTEEINLKKYIVIFMLGVFGGTIFLGIISTFFKSSMAGVSVIIPMVAALVSGQSFVKAYDRAPNVDEAKRLTFFSFFFFVGIQFLFLILALANPALKDVFTQFNSTVLMIIAVFMLFYFAIVFFLIRWGYAGLTQKFAAKRNQQS